MKKQTARKSDSVLGSYQKVGSKFVPPMLQSFQFDHISWASQTLPELIWWDVLADSVSRRFAAIVAEQIAKYFKGRADPNRWWAFISDYSQLSDEDADGLKEHFSRTGISTRMTKSLADFLELYPECPLSRLVEQKPTGIVDVGYLARFENRMEKLEDKRSRNGVLVQAQVLYMGFILGKLRVKQGLALADFPEVENYPKTEKSMAVGASICAAVNGIAGRMLPKYGEDLWVQYFWKRSFDLHPLDFRKLENR